MIKPKFKIGDKFINIDERNVATVGRIKGVLIGEDNVYYTCESIDGGNIYMEDILSEEDVERLRDPEMAKEIIKKYNKLKKELEELCDELGGENNERKSKKNFKKS